MRRRRATPATHKHGRLLAVLLACTCVNAAAFELEMGPVTVQDTFVTPAWTTVSFLQPFDVVPLVFALPTNQGGDPATLRIRNVTTTGFEILQVEPSANDGQHLAMDTAYLAIEPGNHTLPDGSNISAFIHTTTSFVNRFLPPPRWDSVSFATSFGGTPAVLGSIQTVANETGNPPAGSSVPFMDVGIRNVSSTGMQVTLERAESANGSVTLAESIALLVIDDQANVSFTDMFGSAIVLQSLLTPSNIQGWDDGCFANNYAAAFAATPLAVASANSRTGNNGGWVRRCSESATGLGLTIDEDIDNDPERSHMNETAGIVAASAAFHVNFDVDLSVVKTVATLSDPVNGTTDPKAIPVATVGFTIGVQNSGSLSPDDSTLVVSDVLPAELSLCVTSTCLAGGPVILDTSGSPVPPGVTLGAIEYSDDGGATFNYVPVPDVDGFDSGVDAVRITLNGTFASIAPAGPPSFELRMAARVD
ncbi:MAG: hypothetical protein R3358_05250 [Woeseiaceae bacterium]|nr:hypothetical protein [Woeseiaceae bacterium]